MSVCTSPLFRIPIYEESGKSIPATLKPTTLLAMFDTPQLKNVAQEVEDTIVKIIKEAASGARVTIERMQMLSPIIAGAAMSLSSVSVISNALRLRKVKL